MEEHQTLTDEDIDRICDALEKRMANRFYRNIGSGLWYLVWRMIIMGMLALAAYGVVKKGMIL